MAQRVRGNVQAVDDLGAQLRESRPGSGGTSVQAGVQRFALGALAATLRSACSPRFAVEAIADDRLAQMRSADEKACCQMPGGAERSAGGGEVTSGLRGDGTPTPCQMYAT